MWWHLVLAPFVFALLGALLGVAMAAIEVFTHGDPFRKNAPTLALGWAVILGVIGLIAVLAIAFGVDDNIPN